MSEKILFVDDDPNLLAACERNFRKTFQLDTAAGGEIGLEKIAANGPYAVVISDRQMPRMDGIQFLSTVRQRAPDTIRIMLTGNVDLEAAVRVVNEGNIFRFLIKPCPQEILLKTLEDAIKQYRLVTAEKDLLNKTLSGSIKLLTDILAAVDMKSFEKSDKLRGLISEVIGKMPMENAWEVPLAAMLSPIGYLTLPAETVVKARTGQQLSRVEEQLVASAPEIAARFLANIPRLEGVAKAVRYQQKHFDGTGFPPDAVKGEAIPFGSRLLKILADMAQVQAGGVLPMHALNELQARQGWYDPKLLGTVRTCFGGAEVKTAPAQENLSLTVKDLKVGMILLSDVLTKDGTMILSAGHQLSMMSLEKIRNFEQVSGIIEPITVEAPEPVKAK
jgi:response regulator RpfG family c-di-GMP phosphodiesterase